MKGRKKGREEERMRENGGWRERKKKRERERWKAGKKAIKKKNMSSNEAVYSAL